MECGLGRAPCGERPRSAAGSIRSEIFAPTGGMLTGDKTNCSSRLPMEGLTANVTHAWAASSPRRNICAAYGASAAQRGFRDHTAVPPCGARRERAWRTFDFDRRWRIQPDPVDLYPVERRPGQRPPAYCLASRRSRRSRADLEESTWRDAGDQSETTPNDAAAMSDDVVPAAHRHLPRRPGDLPQQYLARPVDLRPGAPDERSEDDRRIPEHQRYLEDAQLCRSQGSTRVLTDLWRTADRCPIDSMLCRP
jgi:hypothetical protein